MRGKFLLLLLSFCTIIKAQVNPVDQAVEYLVEFNQAETQQPDLVQIAEQLSYLQNNPVSLNSATADELLEIPLLNSFLVFNFLEFRRRAGRLLSIYQLADVKGFNKELVLVLRPFVTLDVVKNSSIFPRYFNHQLALRYRQVLQQAAGYKNGAYQGHGSENYVRYRLQGQGKLFAGVTLQRDAGEEFLPNGYAPDFSSFHLEYRLNNTVRSIVVGDFSAEFGQGLTLWSSLAFNKSAEAVSIARFGRGIRHYTGTDENRFLRGAGVKLALGSSKITSFYSNNGADANLVADENNRLVATSLQTSGFHRTVNEIEDKRSQRIQMLGTHVEWSITRFRLGIMALQTQFKYPIQPNARLANANRFAGSSLTHTALDWKWLYGRTFFFGEASFEWQTQKYAVTAGLQVQAADALQWVMQFRDVEAGWFSAFNAPFSETGRDAERGVYLGLNWQLPHYLSLAFFADHFQYTWLRSNLNQPNIGADYMAQLNYKPNAINMYMRFRYQSRPQNVPSVEPIRPVADEQRLSIRWHANIPVAAKLALQLRAEWVDYAFAGREENGLLTFIGMNWRFKPKWQLKARYSIYDTESFSSAIWAYEDDVPYSFTVPAFFNKGNKWYVMVTWQALERMELWFRLADAQVFNASVIGSGNDALIGGRRTELKVLARFTF